MFDVETYTIIGIVNVTTFAKQLPDPTLISSGSYNDVFRETNCLSEVVNMTHKPVES